MTYVILAAFSVVLGGICIAVQAPINAALARHVGSPLVGAAVSFGVGFVILSVAAVVLGQGRSFGRAFSADWWMLMGGVLGAFYVWT